MITCHGLPGSVWFFGPGKGDAEQGEDHPLGWGEPVELQAAGGVGGGQAVEGGQDGPAGGLGGAAFGQQAGQWHAVAEGGPQVGFDQPEDEQGDAGDGGQGLDPVVVVQEDGPDLEGLFQVAVALLNHPLVLVELQDVKGGQQLAGPGSGRLVASAYRPSRRDAAVIAAWLGDQLSDGLPPRAGPVSTVIRSWMPGPMLLATLASTCFFVL